MTVAACILGLALVCFASAEQVSQSLSRLKASKKPSEWSTILKDLGVPGDSIKTLDFNFVDPKGPGIKITRAETFLEDLDLDGKKEGVSQIIFETPPEFGKSGIEYLFLVHSDPKGKPVLLFNRNFSMMKCGYVKNSGLRFSFSKPMQNQGKKILFAISEVRTCDVGGQEYIKRLDTLAWSETGLVFLADSKPKSIERKGDPDGS